MAYSVVGSRSAFGEYLRDLRKRKGITSPAELSRRMNGYTSVSGILKRERGELKITEEYINAFVACVPLSKREESLIWQRLNLFRVQFDLWSADKNILNINLEAAARLDESTIIKCFSPTIIPHVLQVPAYTEGILTTYRCCASRNEIDQTVKVRSEIANRIRNEKHRRVRLVNSESALFNGYGDKLVMIEQLQFLLNQTDLPHLEYRIIPFEKCINLPNDCTFTVYDEMFVAAESAVGNLYTLDNDLIHWIAENFEQLWNEGATGRARNIILERLIQKINKEKVYEHRFNVPA